MTAIALARAAAFADDGTIVDRNAFVLWTQLTPFVRNTLPPAVFDRAYPMQQGDTDRVRQLAKATPIDAIGEIVRRARRTRIVVLNESHESPRDRAFAWQVARALRPLGYRYLAAETFSGPRPGVTPTPIERLIRDRSVRLSTGLYTRDPVFARFIRQALAIRYRPVAYDFREPGPAGAATYTIEDRERIGAQHIVASVLSNDPTGKVLVYVGHGHVAESSAKGEPRMLAQWLKRLTGNDPLTIDQTAFTALRPRPRSRPAHDAAVPRIGARLAVFMAGGRPLVFTTTPGSVDLQVAHPASRSISGRPAWLATLGGRSIPVPAALRPQTGAVLLQAFARGAPDDAVPLDQLIVRAGVAPVRLWLPRGPVDYRIRSVPACPSAVSQCDPTTAPPLRALLRGAAG